MRVDKLKTSDETWSRRIAASRKRRELFEDVWLHYSSLHTDGARAWNGRSSDFVADLPDGHRVRVSLVFRNIEQTMGYLELEDFGVCAQASSYTREHTALDVQRQAVVEQGVYDSMNESGLMQGAERLDQIKLDALICGHGVSYSSWEMMQDEVVVDQHPLLEERDGVIMPKIGKDGTPVFVEVKALKTLYEGVRDDRISPMQFLVDSAAASIGDALWMGFESVIRYDELKNDGRYNLPDSIKPSSFTVKTLAGEKTPGDDYYQEDSVRVIVVWDCTTRHLIHFLECSGGHGKKQNSLRRIYDVHFPVRFDHPNDSPFSWFVPIPSSDQPFGVSQIEHIRIPALEADILRTRRADIVDSQKRLILYDKNKISQTDVESAIDSKKPIAAIGVDIQENGDPGRLFTEVQTAGVPDELLRYYSEPEQDVRQNSGIQDTPFTGADTATESEIQRMIGQARVNRKRNKLFKYLRSVARTHLAFLREFAPEGQHLSITLPDGTREVVMYGRGAFEGKFHLDVTPGGGASSISPIKQKQYLEAYQIVGADMGPQAKLMLARQMLTMLDVPNLNAIMQAAQGHLLGGAMNAPDGMAPQGVPVADPQAVNNGQAIREAVNPME